MGQAIWSGIAVGAGYALMATGFALVQDVCDIVNAAHGAFVVLGMYVMLKTVGVGVTVFLAVLAASLVAAIVALPTYTLFVGPARSSPGHRVQLVYTLLILIASGTVFQLLFGGDTLTVAHTFADVSVPGGALSTIQIATIVSAVLIVVACGVISQRSTVGKLAYAAGRHPLGAQAIGLSVPRVYGSVFVISAALAGLAGGLIVSFQPVQPSLALNFMTIVFLVALVGRNSVYGCLVLGVAYGVVQALLNYYAPAVAAASLTYVAFLIALVAIQVVAHRRVVK